jgi:hypothetical protein
VAVVAPFESVGCNSAHGCADPMVRTTEMKKMKDRIVSNLPIASVRVLWHVLKLMFVLRFGKPSICRKIGLKSSNLQKHARRQRVKPTALDRTLQGHRRE